MPHHGLAIEDEMLLPRSRQSSGRGLRIITSYLPMVIDRCKGGQQPGSPRL